MFGVRGVGGVRMPWPAKPPDEVSTVFGTLIRGGAFKDAPRWASKRRVDVVVNCREVGGGGHHCALERNPTTLFSGIQQPAAARNQVARPNVLL